MGFGRFSGILKSPPNILSISRILLSPISAISLIHGDINASACMLAYAILSDFVFFGIIFRAMAGFHVQQIALLPQAHI